MYDSQRSFETAKVPYDGKDHYYVILPMVNGDIGIQANFHFNFHYLNAKSKKVSIPCPRGTRLHLPDDTSMGKCPICEEFFNLKDKADHTANQQEREAILDSADYYRSSNAFNCYAIEIDPRNPDREYNVSEVVILRLPYSHFSVLQNGLIKSPEELFSSTILKALEADGIALDVPLALYLDNNTPKEDRRYFLFKSNRPEKMKYGNGGWDPSYVEAKYIPEEILDSLRPLADWYLNFHKLPDSDDPKDIFDEKLVQRSLYAYQLEEAGEGSWETCYDLALELVNDSKTAKTLSSVVSKAASAVDTSDKSDSTSSATESSDTESEDVTEVDVTDSEDEDTESKIVKQVKEEDSSSKKVSTLLQRLHEKNEEKKAKI